MAKITFGLGTSHGPQLLAPPAMWQLRVEADKSNPRHFFRGRAYDYPGLLKVRSEDFGPALTPEGQQSHWERCQNAIARLAAEYREAAPDVAVIIGNDQFETYTEVNIPAFSVFWGESVEAIPKTPEMIAKLPPGIAPAEEGYCPPGGARYACRPDLGRHLIGALMEDGFDVAQSTKLPTGPNGTNSVPHAYGYIYRKVMGDDVIPHVPVMVNTHYPPNRPSARRCYEFGRALGRAILSWPEDLTVAVIGSGGMTHYVIDEEFDRSMLRAMQEHDAETICATDDAMFASGGTAEIKNWIPMFGAMEEAGRSMTLVDYVPCYRSPAGTGNGMGFAYWR
jgi:OH-DDVA oxygenase